MIGEKFIEKCLNNGIINDPWPHQIIKDTLPANDFDTLRKECESLDVPKQKCDLQFAPTELNEFHIRHRA